MQVVLAYALTSFIISCYFNIMRSQMNAFEQLGQRQKKIHDIDDAIPREHTTF